MKIEENFLHEKDFSNLKNFILHQETPWFYREYTVNKKDSPYFTFCFFNNNTILSNAFPLIKPLLEKLNYSSIIQVRANLVLKENNPIQQGWHTDYDYKNFKTAIFYITECNGPTLIQDKMIKIYPKENKILIMDGKTKHSAIPQSDVERRVVININYYEK
tara:strand:- start:795 stop:1277 length:483 start_codon:yes stop_codon:yes gene_type:complete